MDQKEFYEIAPDRLDEFHESQGSRFYKLQADALEAYGREKITIFFKSMELTYGITSTMGIVAGFGFTALKEVAAPWLFIMAESLLLLGILSGLAYIRKNYDQEYASLDTQIGKMSEHFNKRNTLYQTVFDQAVSFGRVKMGDIEALQGHDRSTKELFNTPAKQKISKSIQPAWVFYCLVGGSAGLLASFIDWRLLIQKLLTLCQ